MMIKTHKWGGKFCTTKNERVCKKSLGKWAEVTEMEVADEMSLPQSLKFIKKEAKNIKKNAIREEKEERRKERLKNRVCEVTLENIEYEVENKRFRAVLNGEERLFYSVHDLKKAMRKEYRRIGKIRKERKPVSLLPIVFLGTFFSGLGMFILSTADGIENVNEFVEAVANGINTSVCAIAFALACSVLASLVKGKVVLIPRSETYETDDKPKKMSRASITASFIVFSIFTTLVTEATKDAYKSISNALSVAKNLNFEKFFGWVMFIAGLVFIFLAYCMPAIVKFLSWLSGFVKFFDSTGEKEEKKP